MPIQYARKLTGSRRSAQANQQLGLVLAFVAGAAAFALPRYVRDLLG